MGCARHRGYTPFSADAIRKVLINDLHNSRFAANPFPVDFHFGGNEG